MVLRILYHGGAECLALAMLLRPRLHRTLLHLTGAFPASMLFQRGPAMSSCSGPPLPGPSSAGGKCSGPVGLEFGGTG